jgi:hypothetical protein
MDNKIIYYVAYACSSTLVETSFVACTALAAKKFKVAKVPTKYVIFSGVVIGLADTASKIIRKEVVPRVKARKSEEV